MPDRLDRRRWHRIAAAGLVAASFGLGGLRAPVSAQDGGSPADAFGGYTLRGRANGLQVSYNVENVFPLPPPLFQLSVPEAVATTSTGPSTSAFGSAAYPGNVVGNLPAIVAQSKPDTCVENPDGQECHVAEMIPPYPLAVRADSPAGPEQASQDIGTASAVVEATPAGSQAVTTMAGSAIPGLITFGNITTSGQSGFDSGQVVARSRAEFSSIDLLFGLIHLEGVVTDLVATSDGTTAAADGSTTIGSVTVLGQPATIGPDGITLAPYETPPNQGPLGPIVTNLGPLGQVGDGLAQAVAPVNEALQTLLAGANGSLADLLEQAGIHIRTFEPSAIVDGPEASITADGLVVDITYDGRGDNPLATLLAAIPSDQLPGEGIPGFPLNTSPQAMVNLMKETHVTGLALAYGTAEVVASPAFSFTSRPASRPTVSAGTSGTAGTPGIPGTPGFSTPLPGLSTPGGVPIATDAIGAVSGTAVGAMAVILALLASPLWAIGSRRLADNVLAAAGGSCPDGLDRKD